MEGHQHLPPSAGLQYRGQTNLNNNWRRNITYHHIVTERAETHGEGQDKTDPKTRRCFPRLLRASPLRYEIQVCMEYAKRSRSWATNQPKQLERTGGPQIHNLHLDGPQALGSRQKAPTNITTRRRRRSCHPCDRKIKQFKSPLGSFKAKQITRYIHGYVCNQDGTRKRSIGRWSVDNSLSSRAPKNKNRRPPKKEKENSFISVVTQEKEKNDGEKGSFQSSPDHHRKNTQQADGRPTFISA